ncbi:AAA family ATPase [uncultured Dysgonomonas sp.]|uniref:Putative nuclease sbcCD, subunit C n=1 Tax=uncultured Dysgonomonas sp. TaxID=206096 RepID=A0A212IW01_9BACT|nr:AAA family ATPase [uncultured Dysgonomonas sp.]SBV91376.1 putative nuclease sbcCD, subunit C [uncultured Dysgonomonas sp.]
MKILAIRGKNLASLEGEFEVDFTAEPLKSAGIFAITGSTGSGKSTLLDTLCLALFDDIPRNRTAESIRIIDVKDKTINHTDSRNILRRGTSDGYAEVDFKSLGGETFRSRWSVRRSRDKIDGSLQNTEFRLTNLTTNLEVQGRKTELLAKIVELIGLTFDQFTRAVLLAQGDFATFLKATQKEKAELLEKLTGTDIYSRISSSIYEKSKNAEQDLTLLQERIKGIELLSDDDLEALSTEKQAILLELETLKIEVTQLTAKIKWITDEELLANGVKQAEHQLADSQKAIEEAKPRYEYLAKTDRVQGIRDDYNALKNSQEQLADNRANLTKQQSDRDANALLLKQATEQLMACEKEQVRHLEEVSKIEPQIKKARELDIRIVGAKSNLESVTKEYQQTIESKIKIEKSILATQSAMETAEKTIEKNNLWFADHKEYVHIVPRVDLIINLLNDVETAQKQGTNNSKTLAESKEILYREEQKLVGLKTEAERLNNLLPAEIAVLRAKLQDGNPCPVCGSLHHPMADIQGESLEEAELSRAKKEVSDKITSLADSIDKGKSENIRLQSMIDSYATQSAEALAKLTDCLGGLPTWQQEFEQGQLQNRLKKITELWNKYISEQTTTNEQIGKLKTSLEHEHKNLAEIKEEALSKEAKYKNSKTELEKLQGNRSEVLDGKSADAIEKILGDTTNKTADRLKKLTTSKGEIATKGETFAGIISQILADISNLSKRCEDLQKTIDAWLILQNGEISAEQLTELLSKDSSWLTSEREALSRFRENKTSAQATLAERRKNLEKHYEAEIKLADGEEQEILKTILAERNSYIEQKTKRNTEIDMLVANHERGQIKIKAFEKELTEKSTLSENWKKLNDMFGSADGAKFKVLAQGYTLEALLTYANKHLQELSKRYELQRIPDTLGLQVVDLDMLGEVRTVHSLSGGESFLISLALALGLSSLSSNRMKVESLFIDEGFGSLDIDTLRIAMDALEQLQTQGRKIGVISHVAEMTERITTQVRVVKTSNGRSKVEVSGGYK